MATSGTFTYSATAAQAIQEALEILGVLESGRSPTTADQTSCLTTLNMMVKQWSAIVGHLDKREAA